MGAMGRGDGGWVVREMYGYKHGQMDRWVSDGQVDG